MIQFLNPIREKIEAIEADESYLTKVMKAGKEKAHASSSKTVKDVREIIGINY